VSNKNKRKKKKVKFLKYKTYFEQPSQILKIKNKEIIFVDNFRSCGQLNSFEKFSILKNNIILKPPILLNRRRHNIY